MPIIGLYGQFGSAKNVLIGSSSKYFSSFSTALGFGAVDAKNSIIFQKVGEYQGKTFISPGDKTATAEEINNSVYETSSTADVISPELGSYKDIDVNYIPNRAAPLNLRVSDLSSIRVSSCRMYINDGSSTGTSTSFYDFKWYECVHTSTDETAPGSGAASWSSMPAGSTGSIVLRTSPGVSGSNPTGSLSYSTRHDWYICLSLTPAKTFQQSTMNLSCIIDYV
jgi:hypothetical protein